MGSEKIKCYPDDNNFEDSTKIELSADGVIEKYLEAIGGRKQIESIADRTTTMIGETMGKTLSIIVKQKAPSMLRQEINAGTIKQTIIFNGKQGVMMMGEQKSELGGNELDKLKIEAQMNFLLNPESFGVKPELIGIEIIDSVHCYNVSMNMVDSTNWNQFYEVESGLKIKEIKGVETPQGFFEQESFFSDYGEVGNLKFPFKITQTLGAQTIELNIEKIEINSGLKDVLFEIPE
jgi:outer membrane lipoprotein-sorting protein